MPLTLLGATMVAGVALGMLPAAPAPDIRWNTLMTQVSRPVFDVVAYTADTWGAGALGFGLFPALLALPLLLGRRWAAAAGLVVSGAVSLAIVQVIKPLIDRARPEDMLTVSDVGSFPSGHVTNAATLCVFIALTYGRSLVWVAAAAYIALMALSRTYLHAHWLSDVIGGIVLGTSIAMIASAVIARPRPQKGRRRP